ncbi:MAG: energy-coupling factor ABC transporter substrate-binding protein [Clostridium chrysemydis]|uniref:energy-coupling factor ABC transporter substrate-binding protein n=1 Tax=Clostridium TaxID=1485 RepID=UPI0021522073|nr:energy-coupling factor ABC transporter substrate-binding protein [Clostridium sp. LY3-2]MCR6515509.1 energy-coupling factor ABC transporter substrate-binding protein [Clostridium sp. LY3-2]
MKKKNILIIILVAVFLIVPFVINSNGEFEGSDDKANNTIQELDPSYTPWAKSLWEPPSSEIESFLFAAQAAIGAGFIGYFLGYKKGKNVPRDKSIQ